MTNSFKNSFPYVENVKEIKTNGENKNAILTDIELIKNVTINGNNPTILTYEFDINGQKSVSKFSVFDPEKTKDLKEGNTIPIKYLNGKSIPTGYEQYSFNMVLPYYVGGIVFIIGLFFYILLYSRIKKEIDLYKAGRIKQGKIICINKNKGFMFTNFGSSIDVQYEYDINGTKQIGKSRTNNFELTNNKAIGDTVRILISRDGKNSCLYPEIIAKTHEWKEN